MSVTPGNSAPGLPLGDRRGVTFRPLRYGHAVEAQEISKRIVAGAVEGVEMANFVFTLVASWDYTDIETGEPVPIDQPRLLSLAQFNDLMEEFNREMQGIAAVNPQNGARSSSGLTPSRPAKRNSRTPQPG